MISAVGDVKDFADDNFELQLQKTISQMKRESMDTSIEDSDPYSLVEDINHYVFSIDVRLLAIRETILKSH